MVFAEEGYDSTQDVFDSVISTLVPTLIVYMFDKDVIGIRKLKEANSSDSKTKAEAGYSDSETKAEEGSSDLETKDENIIRKIKRKHVLDDFIFLLSLFVLPSVVFYKNKDKFPIPLWISIFLGMVSILVFVLMMLNYFVKLNNLRGYGLKIYIIPLSIEFCHVLSDVSFIFYSKSVFTGVYLNIFVYLHAVTGVICLVAIIIYISFFTRVNSLVERICCICCICCIHLNAEILFRMEKVMRIVGITITFIWTPIIQMFNLSLFSGNDYYWTRSILALNLLYFTRVINYAINDEVVDSSELNNEELNYITFGILNTMFNIRNF
ncbi:28055_t:CDS:1, partial [Dentiscutata erythropus]